MRFSEREKKMELNDVIYIFLQVNCTDQPKICLKKLKHGQLNI